MKSSYFKVVQMARRIIVEELPQSGGVRSRRRRSYPDVLRIPKSELEEPVHD